MARRYDSGTTTFSPEGRLYQVEYATTAIQNAAAAIGIQSPEGIVIAGEKKILSKLLAPPKASEKMYKVDEHMFTAVAGLNSDANILIQQARLAAQRYLYTYGEPQPVEQLVQLVSDYKQAYTQRGGLRPFGVSFLLAGWDKQRGYQLFKTEPSGNYGGWKATAIGSNSATAMSTLKTEYKEDLSLREAQKLAVRVLTKTMDIANPTSDRIEIAVLTRVPVDGGALVLSQRVLTAAEADELIREAVPAAPAAAPARGDI